MDSDDWDFIKEYEMEREEQQFFEQCVECFVWEVTYTHSMEAVYQAFKKRLKRELLEEMESDEPEYDEPEQFTLRRATDQLPSVPLDLSGVGDT